MGRLIDGVWTTGADFKKTKDGKFVRADAKFRNWITVDGSAGTSGESGFEAEADRYHLYVSYACPWAHRTLIFRKLKGLEDLISYSVVSPLMLDQGWTFDADFVGSKGDDLYGSSQLHQIYTKASPDFSGRVTVPVLWDKKRQTIVSNESSEIIRMFNSEFDHLTGNTDDFWPAQMREEIEEVNERIYHTFNNGVYRTGFASKQAAYDEAVGELFDTLDWLEDRLSKNHYLMGDQITEADWRLVATLFRFDLVYNIHFKCSRNRIVDFPNLWSLARELYQWTAPDGSAIADTVKFDHIAHHYYRSHESINAHRIVPLAQPVDWTAPNGRKASSAA